MTIARDDASDLDGVGGDLQGGLGEEGALLAAS